MARLAGKVAIVTGAAQGMGAATARLFAAEGARVVLCDVIEDKGQETASEIGESAVFQKLDVRSEADWERVVADTVQRFGKLDILINNAAIVHFSPIEAMPAEDIERVLAINVMGTMLGAKYAARAMTGAGRGVIVNISSVDGLRGCNGLSAYTASKWAVRGLSKSLAYELGPRGIRVCTVHPGGVNTQMGNPTGLTGDALNVGYERVPLQRIGEPEEIARASLFIASDDASYISGAELAVDGGWSAGYYQPFLPGAPASLNGQP
ncbi:MULTISPECIES: glucose 1-dehydrogenase [unclassified Sphingopyxis]|uniref:SDR family NAD(P)-dependent oxidoreductase n=1 Tax=unclassified Sphingopyxis TaxID=2614943 RepID=UPI00286133CD|nr:MULTISPECIES: glucose 1-dehydrogenase [unclassified Sphingopyxis]MDR7059281.1 3alpha(or 20beta)-hydroxysteroid dehydrogenase [Sphingopyxis sp. BE235]MDR7178533.1 3alpha(or 20beta)-hydroxysteroid dehydrogenase [Sphingopyxis sp. BE249]